MHGDSVMNAGVCTILSQQPDISLSPVTSSPLAGYDYDVIVTDYASGIGICQSGQLLHRSVPARVLVMSTLDKEWPVRCAVDRGVHGYLLQNCSAEELIVAIRTLNSGRRYYTPAISHHLISPTDRNDLTCREIDVLRLLGKGYCNKLIARELDIGVGTVKTHLKNVMSKLNATARTHAVIVAAERGMISSHITSEREHVR